MNKVRLGSIPGQGQTLKLNIMNNVNIWCWAHNSGENLRKGACFEEALLLELLGSKEYFADDKYFKLLFKELEELKGTKHPQDILDDFFRSEVTIDFEFAKQLKLYDIITADCFHATSHIGQGIANLMGLAGLRFILRMKSWDDVYEINVEFESTHYEYEREVHLSLINGML